MESNVQISPEYLCGVLFSASNAKVGNPALDYISACLSPHPSNATHRSPEMANSSPRGRPIAVFPWPAPTPSSISLLRKNLCLSSNPRLGVKTDSKPRGGSTFLHLLSRLITRAPVVFVFFLTFAKASVLTLPPKKLHLKISPVKPTCNRKR